MYYIVDGEPIFITHSRRQLLDDEALKEWSALLRVTSDIAGNRANEEADKLRYNTLQAKFRNNPGLFRQQWLEFNLIEDEAQTNVWDLIYDYCHFYRTGHLTELRDFDKFVAEYADDIYTYPTYPMGRLFALDHEIGVSRGWPLRLRKAYRTVRVVIDSAKVRRAVGTLRSFRVIGLGYLMFFRDKDLTILPLARSTAPNRAGADQYA